MSQKYAVKVNGMEGCFLGVNQEMLELDGISAGPVREDKRTVYASSEEAQQAIDAHAQEAEEKWGLGAGTVKAVGKFEIVPVDSQESSGQFVVKIVNWKRDNAVTYLQRTEDSVRKAFGDVSREIIEKSIAQTCSPYLPCTNIADAARFNTHEEAEAASKTIAVALEKSFGITDISHMNISVVDLSIDKPTDSIPQPTVDAPKVIVGSAPYIVKSTFGVHVAYIGEFPKDQEDLRNEGSVPVFLRSHAMEFATVEAATAAVMQLLKANPEHPVKASTFIIEPKNEVKLETTAGFVIEDRSDEALMAGGTHVAKTHEAHDNCLGYGLGLRHEAEVFKTRAEAQKAKDSIYVPGTPAVLTDTLHIVPASDDPFYIEKGNAALN